jgi:hypothetical protein
LMCDFQNGPARPASVQINVNGWDEPQRGGRNSWERSAVLDGIS